MKEAKRIWEQHMNRRSGWQRVTGQDGKAIGYVHKVKGGWAACDRRKRAYRSWDEGANGPALYSNPNQARDAVRDEWVMSL
jgi:hypothetical protein